MRIRKPAADGGMRFGGGATDFHRDVPDAPALLARYRLAMFLGEWWLNLRAGTPWNTKVLGRGTGDTRDPVIRDRILGTQGITKITAYDSTLDRDTRGFASTATVETVYGPTTVEAPR